MSITSMLKEDYGCDFPGCDRRFDPTPDAKVAIAKNKEVLAFCVGHAARLIHEGVVLKTLDEARSDRDGNPKERLDRERREREQTFIQNLK